MSCTCRHDIGIQHSLERNHKTPDEAVTIQPQLPGIPSKPTIARTTDMHAHEARWDIRSSIHARRAGWPILEHSGTGTTCSYRFHAEGAHAAQAARVAVKAPFADGIAGAGHGGVGHNASLADRAMLALAGAEKEGDRIGVRVRLRCLVLCKIHWRRIRPGICSIAAHMRVEQACKSPATANGEPQTSYGRARLRGRPHGFCLSSLHLKPLFAYEVAPARASGCRGATQSGGKVQITATASKRVLVPRDTLRPENPATAVSYTHTMKQQQNTHLATACSLMIVASTSTIVSPTKHTAGL